MKAKVKTKLRLPWLDSDSGDRYGVKVWFPGGFQLCVHRFDRRWRQTKDWRVWWGEDMPGLPSLTDRRFRTCLAAQRAAERIFVPFVAIAPLLIRVDSTIVSVRLPRRKT